MLKTSIFKYKETRMVQYNCLTTHHNPRTIYNLCRRMTNQLYSVLKNFDCENYILARVHTRVIVPINSQRVILV